MVGSSLAMASHWTGFDTDGWQNTGRTALRSNDSQTAFPPGIQRHKREFLQSKRSRSVTRDDLANERQLVTEAHRRLTTTAHLLVHKPGEASVIAERQLGNELAKSIFLNRAAEGLKIACSKNT